MAHEVAHVSGIIKNAVLCFLLNFPAFDSIVYHTNFSIDMQKSHRFHFRYTSIAFAAILICVCSPLPAQNYRGNDEGFRRESEQFFRSAGSFVGKALRVANTVVSEIGSEIREFRKDIEECCPEFYEVRDSLKSQTRRELEQCRREMHRGFRQGLRGESYDPGKD